MTHRRRLIFLATASAIPLIALATAACGGGGGNATAAAPLPTTSGQAATIGVGRTNLGTILIGPQGRTLYLFKSDSSKHSTCMGACAVAWPPLLTNGKPTVGNGANGSLVGTITRPDGTTQVTYNGHPVYRFANDHQPGETNGQGLTAFGAAWFALTPSGNQASGPAANSGSSGY